MHKKLLAVVATILPILMLIFVTTLLLIKVFINIRSRYNATVNCWFCNVNTRVPYTERNCWTCPHCEQYNGFNKDGDYNRDILSQRDSSGVMDKSSSHGASLCANAYYTNVPASPAMANGLCDQCNEAQRLKVEKLAQFEPKHESRFESELKNYKGQLEEQFRLCSSCESHVSKVLREKKKMVLGSKFLNFIIKGAALLKQPHFHELAKAQEQRKLRRYQQAMTLLTLLNVYCLLCSLPLVTREQFAAVVGDALAPPLFVAYSHVMALVHVLGTYGTSALEQRTVAKLLLYARTFSKMLLYSVGLTQLQVQNATFSSCFTSVYPYAMLTLTFMYNVTDGLKFTRFTMLLVLWSVYAKLFAAIDGLALILLCSIATLALLATNRVSYLQLSPGNECSVGSFHRLCADDCFSDEDTISMLSQQFSCSSNSLSLPSSSNNTLLQRKRNGRMGAPSVLSLDSLNLSSQRAVDTDHLPSPSYLLSNRNCNTPLYSPSHLAMSHEQPGWRSNYGMPSPGAANIDGMSNGFTSPNSWLPNFAGYPREQRMQSPVSLASNPVHQRLQTRSSSNLLLPSRFTTNALYQLPMQHNGDVSDWLATASSMSNDIGSAKAPRYDEKMSRTSSQSSGFESQAPPRLETPASQYLGFQPMSPSGCGDYGWPVPQRQVQPPSTFAAQSNAQFERGQTTIKRGDLLRKWIDRSTVDAQKTNS